MNRSYKECDIVLDLLPLYIDGKTGEESNEYVEEHIAHCEECKSALSLMKSEIPVLKRERQGKKKRRKHWKSWMYIVLGLLIYMMVAMGITIRMVYLSISSL